MLKVVAGVHNLDLLEWFFFPLKQMYMSTQIVNNISRLQAPAAEVSTPIVPYFSLLCFC